MALLEKVVIFGAANYASFMHFYLSHDSPYDVVGFTVDAQFLKEDTMFGLPVVPFQNVQSVFSPSTHKMSVPLSFRNMNKVRAEKYAQAKAKGYELISYISSKAITWPGLVIGDNSYITEQVVINPFARIGNDIFVAPGCLIGHHSIVQDHCFLAGHSVLLGETTIGDFSFLGANSTIREGVRIARESLIGAGVTINHDTVEKGVYTGQPAVLSPKPSNELSGLFTWPLR